MALPPLLRSFGSSYHHSVRLAPEGESPVFYRSSNYLQASVEIEALFEGSVERVVEWFLPALPPWFSLLAFFPDTLVFLGLVVAFDTLELLPVDGITCASSGLAVLGWLSVDGITPPEGGCASSDAALGKLAVDGVICASSADSICEGSKSMIRLRL